MDNNTATSNNINKSSDTKENNISATYYTESNRNSANEINNVIVYTSIFSWN